VRDALLAALPLALGSVWTFGLWGLAGLPLDLLAAFTIPLLFGTGIDLGGHAVHWKRLHPERGLKGAAEDMGLALSLATLTTVIGFGSLFSSRVPGLRHAGILVGGGIAACLLATILVLPALEAGLERTERNRRPKPEPWDNKATDNKSMDDGKDERRLS
jgi:predicted RND superfamily exporter protein